MMNRKNFLYTMAGTAGALTILRSPALAQATQQEPPPIPVNIVKDFVGAGHRDLSKVQSMMSDYPNIVHCTYDWGNGDFESAIEGAGHVGQKAIAEYLIENGSRITLYALAMLGKTELVKPVLEAFPKLVFANGPHGFTLLHHAKLAGKDGEELVNYLQEKGLKELKVKIK
jgi:ankyrin repeat protein